MIFGAAFALEPSKPILPATWLPNPHENWLDTLIDSSLGECPCVATVTYNIMIFMVSSLESTSHACRKKFPRTSSVIRTHYHTHLLKQKSKCVFTKRIKDRPTQSAPRAHQQCSTPGRCSTRYATLLHTSCSRTLTQRQQRLSSQRIRIHAGQ
jgi:hypothetical protein